MRKWWATIVAALAAAVSVVAPPIQNAISAHPTVSAVLAFAYAILAHLLPSPISEGK